MKIKVLIAYVLTFILLFINTPLFDGISLVEIGLKEFGVTSFYSGGDTGLYYPSFVMLILGALIYVYLLKVAPKTKYSQNYFYYSFGLLVVFAVTRNFLS